MSTLAISPVRRAVRFYDAPIGKKVMMAVTGIILFGYVLGHMLGNLQIFSSNPQQINNYAAFLHSPANVGPLWAIRLILLAAVILHITAAVQLWAMNNAARPIGYVKKTDVPSAYAARTMRWSGVIVGAFIIFHVLHLTSGAIPGLDTKDVGGNPNMPDVRTNVITGFSHPLVAAFYILAMVLLCMHLYHGLYSLFQSLGLAHPRYTPKIKAGAAVFAILVCIGFISVPVAVLAGFLQ
ncbi:MAG TPA: succinate dehydrogenase cytochrome b subunit [Candidatus Limnocylindrales bacterium]|nr:succinate dehydrogenase cytochrome b subunit [Candidatus Limnocylindrales bacterium]